jgi:hypothetical protein
MEEVIGDVKVIGRIDTILSFSDPSYQNLI